MGNFNISETASKEDMLKLDCQLCFPLYACARKIQSKYTPILKPLGITYTQYLVFLVLWEEENITVGELCRRLYLDSGTITPLLKKMEKEGFLIRKRCPEDERCVMVSLTDKGRDMKAKALDVPGQMKQCINLNSEEAQILYKTLYRLLEQE